MILKSELRNMDDCPHCEALASVQIDSINFDHKNEISHYNVMCKECGRFYKVLNS